MSECFDYSEKALTALLKAVKELADEGEDIHDGPLIDLANIVKKIVADYKRRGIDYVVDTYWKGKIVTQPTALFVLTPHDPLHEDQKFEIAINRQMLNKLSRWTGASFCLEKLYGTAAPNKRRRTKGEK